MMGAAIIYSTYVKEKRREDRKEFMDNVVSVAQKKIEESKAKKAEKQAAQSDVAASAAAQPVVTDHSVKESGQEKVLHHLLSISILLMADEAIRVEEARNFQ